LAQLQPAQQWRYLFVHCADVGRSPYTPWLLASLGTFDVCTAGLWTLFLCPTCVQHPSFQQSSSASRLFTGALPPGSLLPAGLHSFEAIRVNHCADAWGVALASAAGWRLVHSGDTRPCAAVRRAAMGATLLIHEATFEPALHAEVGLRCQYCPARANPCLPFTVLLLEAWCCRPAVIVPEPYQSAPVAQRTLHHATCKC
jgi:hypothetical protein